MNTKNQPTYMLYQVIDIEKDQEKSSLWNRVGAAWPHQKGEGFNILLNALPLSGRLVMRKIEEEVKVD